MCFLSVGLHWLTCWETLLISLSAGSLDSAGTSHCLQRGSQARSWVEDIMLSSISTGTLWWGQGPGNNSVYLCWSSGRDSWQIQIYFFLPLKDSILSQQNINNISMIEFQRDMLHQSNSCTCENKFSEVESVIYGNNNLTATYYIFVSVLSVQHLSCKHDI